MRSIAEIRGQYGLAEDEFRVLAEGNRDRTVGTVLGRERRAAPKKMVPVQQAVMGTAKLEQPQEVASRRPAKAPAPKSALRWWPLLAGALIVPAILASVYLLPRAPAPADAEKRVLPAGERIEAPSQPAAAERATLPQMPKPVVHSTAVRRAEPAVSTAPSATAAPAKSNGLPEFPDLEEQ